jgi:hypothetical protein
MRFDSDNHQYYITVNGVERKVPSVTQVLKDLLPTWRASEFFLGKGRAVHAAAAFVARGIAFEHDPRISGQVEAVRKFFREIRPTVMAVERPVYSTRYLYGGTLDLVCEINKRIVVADYKAAITPATIYQCAAYGLVYPKTLQHGMGVELHENGSYKLSEVWDLKRAQQEWLSLLTAFRIRERLGCLSKEDGDD